MVSQNRQVPFYLILADVLLVIVPLDLLVLDALVKDVISQGFPHQFAAFHLVDGLKEAAGGK